MPNHWANIFVQSLGPAGVDALIGPCGAVDQFMASILEMSCHDFGGGSGSSGSGNGGGGAGSGGKAGGGILPSLPKPPLPKPKISHRPLPLPSPTLPIGLSYVTAGGAGGNVQAAMPGTIEDLLDFVLAGTDWTRR